MIGTDLPTLVVLTAALSAFRWTLLVCERRAEYRRRPRR